MPDRPRHATHIQQPPQGIEPREDGPATDAPPQQAAPPAQPGTPPPAGTDAPPQSAPPSGATTDAPPQGVNAPSAPVDAGLPAAAPSRAPLRAPAPVARGDGRVAYAYNHEGEWLPAETATHDDLGNPLPEPAEGHRHLLVQLDPEKHRAAGDRALRLNVAEGEEAGSFRGR